MLIFLISIFLNFTIFKNFDFSKFCKFKKYHYSTRIMNNNMNFNKNQILHQVYQI